jgi:NAD(P) transhydrogenase subunit beta
MSLNLVTLLYLVASVCFIQALKGLSHPTSSIRGNLFGMVGMGIAAVTTGALIVKLAEGRLAGMGWVLIGLLAGGVYGAWRAKTVEMTKMPELVAFFHSMIGLAAVFIAVAAVAEPAAMLHGLDKGAPIPTGNRLELFLGAAIGAITFSGSVIAFGKLSGTYKFRLFKGAPVVFPGQHMLNLVLGIATIGLGLAFMATESWPAFFAMLALAFVMGVLIIIPIGGADMPVVVSMLNSYSGWAAAGIGFSLNNSMLIIAGSLVGSSGAILSYIMCKAMNRSVCPAGPGQRPLKLGARLSSIEATASRWSSVLWHMPWNTAQWSRKSPSSMRSADFIRRLVRRSACGGLAAKLRASSWARSNSTTPTTTSSTMPSSLASSASRTRPEKVSSAARW